MTYNEMVNLKAKVEAGLELLIAESHNVFIIEALKKVLKELEDIYLQNDD